MESNTNASTSKEVATSFTCALCSSSFGDNVEQRMHVKSPWHIYNLKRRIASLPPLSKRLFEEKILLGDKASGREEGDRSGSSTCSICQKTYDTAKAYQTHLKSRNHLQKLASVESEPDSEVEEDEIQHLAAVASRMENLKIGESTEEEDEEDEEEFDEEVCLFCLHDSEDLDENMQHMYTIHSLFIPNLEGLTDLPSFLAYLHLVITQFHECLYCGCSRGTAEGVRAHMTDKGHCMVNLDADELSEFWEEGEETGKGKGVEIGDDEKMALPGGKVVGRRDQARRYKQHQPSLEIRTQRRAIAESEEESGEPSTSSNLDRRLAACVPNTEMGLIGLSEVERRSLRVVEMKMLKIEMRARNEYRHVVEKGGNKQMRFKVRKTRTLLLPPGIVY